MNISSLLKYTEEKLYSNSNSLLTYVNFSRLVIFVCFTRKIDSLSINSPTLTGIVIIVIFFEKSL